MPIELRRTTSRDPAFAALVRSLDVELAERDGDDHGLYAPHNVLTTETAVVASVDGAAAGCGCFKSVGDGAVELKRMFVAPAHRGAGVGAAVLRELEAWAGELGHAAIILETGPRNVEAVRLYETRGYTRIPNYGPYADIPSSICMRKPLR